MTLRPLSQIAACTSGFGAWSGSAKRPGQEKPHFDLEEFSAFVAAHGVGGVELPPLRYFPSVQDPALLALAKCRALIVDSDLALDVSQIEALAPFAKEYGTGLIRIKTSNVLGCQRHRVGMPWPEHVSGIITWIKKVLPVLKHHDIKLAIENHQDLDSWDLEHILAKVDSSLVGLNWDVGNSFATCELPLDFAVKFPGKIFNVHLKDYALYDGGDGIGLSRCTFGGGEVDWKEVLPFLDKTNPGATWAFEAGAQPTRWVDYRRQDFWSHVLPRAKSQKESFDTFARQRARTLPSSGRDVTAWEKGASMEQVISSEKAEFRDSGANYLKL